TDSPPLAFCVVLQHSGWCFAEIGSLSLCQNCIQCCVQEASIRRKGGGAVLGHGIRQEGGSVVAGGQTSLGDRHLDPAKAWQRRTARASAGPAFKGVCKQFSRSQGHGFITPENGTEDIFVHVSDIEGEYVPVEGDEVTYKICPIPPKNQKFQAVEVVLTNLAPHTKHETWSGQIIGS
uniref:Cold shock domain containing C2 n=1 Tax=Pelusios castaneus TaxID=367368 RepID=A0A8C8RC89_9SAUR